MWLFSQGLAGGGEQGQNPNQLTPLAVWHMDARIESGDAPVASHLRGSQQGSLDTEAQETMGLPTLPGSCRPLNPVANAMHWLAVSS